MAGGGFGAKGRGGRKRLFDDRIPASKDSKETAAARQRAEKLQAHINYQPRPRYPVSLLLLQQQSAPTPPPPFSPLSPSSPSTSKSPRSAALVQCLKHLPAPAFSAHTVATLALASPTMRKGAKVTFREEPKRKKNSAAHRKPQSSSSKVAAAAAASGNASGSARKMRRPRRSSDAVFRHRKPDPAPKPKPTSYDPEHGWLTPWKKLQQPISPAPTAREADIIEKWKENRKAAKDGPLFVRRVVDVGARVGKSTPAPLGMTANGFTAFNILPTYTAKYERRYRQRPKMDGKLWLKPFLPKELWDVVDPSMRKDRLNGSTGLTKANTNATRFNLADFSDNEDEAAPGAVDEDGNAIDDSDAEAEVEPDEVDEDWEDDEDEGDDYNGEKYFDDGEKDDIVGDDYEAADDVGGGEVEYEREFAPNEEFDV